MVVMYIIIGALSAFLGFAIGRIGDKLGGHLNFIHHWILGVIMMIPGGIFIYAWIGFILLCAGLGLFISDLNDFIHFRIWGPDVAHEWKFFSTK